MTPECGGGYCNTTCESRQSWKTIIDKVAGRGFTMFWKMGEAKGKFTQGQQGTPGAEIQIFKPE